MEEEIQICTICEKRCRITMKIDGNRITDLQGHQCYQGIGFANDFLKASLKTISTSVVLKNHSSRMLPVRTSRPVRSSYSMAILKESRNILVDAPVRYGQVVAKNIAGSGAELISLKEVHAE